MAEFQIQGIYKNEIAVVNYIAIKRKIKSVLTSAAKIGAISNSLPQNKMVLLGTKNPSRKRPPPSTAFVPPFARPKPSEPSEPLTPIDNLTSVLADAGCTLVNPSGPPLLPSDANKFRNHLDRLFSADSDVRLAFLSGFRAYIQSPLNFQRVLACSYHDGSKLATNDSLVRVLLLVPSIQLELQIILLEKLPEYFDSTYGLGVTSSSSSSVIQNDVARLVLNQFRWLDFLVDPKVLGEKIFEVLSICPFQLKKEMIGSLPEIIGNQNNVTIVESLKQMLEEDSSIIVSVLDSFSNLNLDEHLQDQVISIALSCIRTIDAEHMPCLLRFLLLSASTTNARKIISKIREQLKLIGMPNTHMTQKQRLKGKAPAVNTDALILDALRSSLLFKNILCEEILKEIKSLERAQDHKVIDIWLLMLIYMNGDSLKRNVEKIFRKKIIEGCLQNDMFDQCIYAKKELLLDYFRSFLSLAEFLLVCKEEKPREVGIHVYILLFKELTDTYSRQEVLGSLVTHMGSGISFEVTSAMEGMFLLASNHAEELLPLSSHISGILDYLEGFSVENLHKVYEIFSLLALTSWSSAESIGGSIRNELLMIVRKQVSNSDLKYKKMGLIGTLKVVSCLGDSKNVIRTSSSQKSNYEESLELLKTSMESCKQSPLPLIMFYDELSSVVDEGNLHPAITEWIGKHAGEFESLFLSDLEGGKLPTKDSYSGLEGELWMNLDGDISPVCMDILPLVSASIQSASSLQSLPARFLLLSVIERVANNGSLEGIDALLGCPLHLPSFKMFSEPTWHSLTGMQKEVICLSLYYGANWIRELLNAFCTQVSGRFGCISQATKDEIVPKLFKRLRNLVFLESLLNYCMKKFPTSLPDLHPHVEHFACSLLNQPKLTGNSDKGEDMKQNGTSSPKRKKKESKSKSSSCSDVNGKFKQPTIIDVLRKAGAIPSQDGPNQDSSGPSSKDSLTDSTTYHSSDSSEIATVEISEAANILEAQRYKFRPLLVESFAILASSEMKNQGSGCTDPAAELPLHLYLLRDLHRKLDCYNPSNKQFPSRVASNPPGLSRMSVNDFLNQIRHIFPSLRKHLSCAIHILKQGDESYQEHWSTQSAASMNPKLTSMVVSKFSLCTSVSKEILFCFSKMLTLPTVQAEKSILSNILEAFQTTKSLDRIFSGMERFPSPGSIDFLYCGAFLLLEEILEEALNFSFLVASEVLLALDSIVSSLQKCLENLGEGNCKEIKKNFPEELLPALHNRLESSAHRLLKHSWNSSNLENGWKGKGEVIQKVLQIYLVNNESTIDVLEKLACSVLSEDPLCSTLQDDYHGYPTLCAATFVVWYRVMHEENLVILNKLVKEVGMFKKLRPGFQEEAVKVLLNKLQKSVNVIVSLVEMCRIHEKISVHALAVKYGGKFIDCFLKVFEFLQAQFSIHNELILQLVKELQKATRTLQALCSEAKGMKQTAITIKIPATKRSLERFLFHVKALLHSAPNICTFWMGNLKHKNLTGHVVSSQVYVDEQNENGVEDCEEAAVEDIQDNNISPVDDIELETES